MIKENQKLVIGIIRQKYEIVNPYLNERSRRIWAASETKILGKGGQTILHKATGLDCKTIKKGIIESENKNKINRQKIRQKGGGRKTLIKIQKNLESDLNDLLESSTRGDPMSPLLWTSKSSYNLTKILNDKNHKICQKSVYNLVDKLGYSLQANRKTQEGGDHIDRDKQFNFINEKVKIFQKNKNPVISVDTKKKENIGNFKNNGKEYFKKKNPLEVNVYDFIDKEKGKASPYGIYDILKNNGWVSVGISSDTAEFAVNSIKSWWNEMGLKTYPKAKEIYINADGGGSNGSRVRLWKIELQKFANEFNLKVHVSHFPPGTSKWNKIEHRMFSFISKNWRGKPLIDTATIVNLIANTKTKTGLQIKARLDTKHYEKGIKISDKELAKINLLKDTFHGEWNYVISPAL